MMHPIQAAAVAIADSMNDRVVASALEAYSGPCKRCDYERHSDMFRDVLGSYVIWKMRYERMINRHFYGGRQDFPTWGGIENIYFNLISASNALDEVWPCQRCIERYNPTHRTRRLNRGRRRRNPGR